MPQVKQQSASNFAALSFELVTGVDGVTTEAHLLPVGPFRAVDGRPVECKAWQLDAAIAAKVIALAASRKNDILIDFEHQSLRSRDNGKRADAAGWIPRTLEWRDGIGLFAANITWVGETQELIAQKRYRYISTVFYYSCDTGEVLEIVSVALTNTPAIDGLDPLAALARAALTDLSTPAGDSVMPLTEKEIAALTAEHNAAKTQVVALTAERDGLTAKVAALTTERDGLNTKVADLSAKVASFEKEKAEAALAADKAKHGELLAAALTDGRLTPAQKPWAEKQSLAALTEYLDATKPLAMLGKQAGDKDAAGNHGLNADELAVCARAGLTPEEFAKSKKP
ncbi:MAG: phage protease [Gallionella sp.]|nr:phage protease [Gallionella sp.]MDD4947436.1 phage protease [Gallionella sp.]MDD5612443.1 phage protease [Gallionella sp.]